MILGWRPVAAATGRVGVAVAVVVVPDGAVVARVGLEEEARHGKQPPRFRAADRAVNRRARVAQRALPLEARLARGAGVVVAGQRAALLSLVR